MNKTTKIRLCAEFLARCLQMGWQRKNLDALQQIWWDYGGWRHTGEYRRLHVAANCPGEAKARHACIVRALEAGENPNDDTEGETT